MAVTVMETCAPGSICASAGITEASQVTTFVVLYGAAFVGGTLNPVKKSPEPSVSVTTALAARPSPAFSTVMVQVTVSSAPLLCRLGVLEIVRLPGIMVTKVAAVATFMAPPSGCWYAAVAINSPEGVPHDTAT